MATKYAKRWHHDHEAERTSKNKNCESKKVEKAKKLTKQEAISRVTDYMRNENMELEDEKLRAISEMVYDESYDTNWTIGSS